MNSNIRQKRPSQARRYRAMFVLFFLVIGVTGYLYWMKPSIRQYRVSTGAPSGIYHAIGKQLDRMLTDDVGFEVTVLESEGSDQNGVRIQANDCEFALVQNDTTVRNSIRSVAGLYREQLHFIVNPQSGINSLSDLRDMKVSIGSEQDGTHSVTEALLKFSLGENYGGCLVEYDEMQTALKKLKNGELDAGFFVTGVRSPALLEALRGNELELLPIMLAESEDDKDAYDLIRGFRTVYPFVELDVIPMRAYGSRPLKPVPTLAITAVLVCHKDVPESTVNQVTNLLFEAKAELAQFNPIFASLNEQDATHNLQFPLHTGADGYYRRREPTFLAKHAESMGFVLTLVVLLGSSFKGLTSWNRRRSKDYIDTYYERSVDIRNRLLKAGSNEDLTRISEEIEQVDLDASKDLVAEELKADAAFLILCHMIRAIREDLALKRDAFIVSDKDEVKTTSDQNGATS